MTDNGLKTIMIDGDLHERLKIYCKLKGKKMGFVIETILRLYLEQNEHTIEKWKK